MPTEMSEQMPPPARLREMEIRTIALQLLINDPKRDVAQSFATAEQFADEAARRKREAEAK